MSMWTSQLPKVELHAHLNGSLNLNSIRELGEKLYGANTKEFISLSKQFIEFNENSKLEECFNKFKFMHELTATKQGLALATQLIIRDFVHENVIYLELRTTPKENRHMTKREYLEIVLNAINAAKTMYNGVIVKLLPSIDRSQSVAEAIKTLDAVCELKPQYPMLLTGIDLSGNPMCGQFKDFVPLLEKMRRNGYKLALHCGEVDNPVEIADMLQFGMDRCGHGTFLSTSQGQELGARNVAIECCLTSNVKCGTVRNYNDHHFGRIFNSKTNMPAVVLCTDDAGVFDTTLTQEFILAERTFGLSKQNLYCLSLNAVDHAFANDSEKEIMRNCIIRYFEKEDTN